MEKKLEALRLGSPVRFRDRWEGRLSIIEVDESWEVTNLVVKRGALFFSGTVKLPFSSVSDFNSSEISFDCTSEDAFSRKIVPLAVPGFHLSIETRLSAPGVLLTGVLVERRTTRLRYVLVRERGPLGGERRAAVEQLSFEGGQLRLGTQAEGLPVHRDDDEIVTMIREAWRKHPNLMADDRRAMAIEVADGRVRLSGNARTAQAKRWAEEAARSVDGMAGIESEIIDDMSLEMKVAQALSRQDLFQKAIVYPRAFEGQVTLQGYAESLGVVDEIVRVTSRLPGVRGVVNRLEVRKGQN